MHNIDPILYDYMIIMLEFKSVVFTLGMEYLTLETKQFHLELPYSGKFSRTKIFAI